MPVPLTETVSDATNGMHIVNIVDTMMTRISHLRVCAVAVVAAAAGRCHTCWLSLYPSSLAVKVDIVWSETL